VVKTSAQITFQKTYGDSAVNDIGQSVLQTDDGGFVIAATRFNSSNLIATLFLIRANDIGDTLWTKLINEPTINYSGSQIIKTFDHCFAITGIKGGGNTFVPYLLKIDSAGNITWNKTYLWFADEHINSIIQTPDSGFLLAGYLYNGNNLVYFIRTNSVGDTLWTKSYGETFFNANVYSVRQAIDGGFIAAGSIQNTNTQDVDAFLFKTDFLGNVEWAKGYGDAGYDYAQQVEVTADHGFVLAAVTYSFGVSLSDFYLVKTDSAGNVIWSKTYGGISDDRSESVMQTWDGGYLVTGESASFSSGNFDTYMIRTDASGDTLWTRTINGLQSNEGYSQALTSDSGFAIAGSYLNQFGNNDVFLVKSKAIGLMDCSEHSTSTAVSNPATQMLNHHMDIFPASPSVLSHTMNVSSGANVETLCNMTAIDIVSEAIQLTVYPNPVSEKFVVESEHAIYSVRLLNMIGSDVKTFTLKGLNHFEVNISELKQGMYFLVVESDNRCSAMKLLKQ